MEKNECLQKLREAAAEYKKDSENGWMHIGFLVKRKDTGELELWHQEARQVVSATET